MWIGFIRLAIVHHCCGVDLKANVYWVPISTYIEYRMHQLQRIGCWIGNLSITNTTDTLNETHSPPYSNSFVLKQKTKMIIRSLMMIKFPNAFKRLKIVCTFCAALWHTKEVTHLVFVLSKINRIVRLNYLKNLLQSCLIHTLFGLMGWKLKWGDTFNEISNKFSKPPRDSLMC